MNQDHHRRILVQTGLLLAIGVRAAPARACEYVTRTMRIVHPWTRATADNAAQAVLCMSFADVVETDRLVGVETPVAGSAEMGGPDGGGAVDLAIPVGRETVLTESGVHVRLTDLEHGLEVGRAYPLTLTFEKSGQVLALLNVDYARFR